MIRSRYSRGYVAKGVLYIEFFFIVFLVLVLRYSLVVINIRGLFFHSNVSPELKDNPSRIRKVAFLVIKSEIAEVTLLNPF